MKTFTKTAIALSTGMLLSNAALAAGPLSNDLITVYGKVNVTLQSDDTDERQTNLESNASRIGIKGGLKIDDNLKAIYKLEWQVDVADDESENFKSRSQWVGLEGNFGSVMLGRNDTVLKKSQGKVDLFSDYNGDIKTLFSGENRLDDTVTYLSPTFNGFKFGATLVAEDNEDSEGETGTSLALMYGDSGLKKSKFYAAVALDSDVAGSDTTRVTVGGKIGDLKLGAMFNDSEYADGSSDGDGFLVSAAYNVGKVTYKAQYQDSDDKVEAESFSLGLDYKLAKSFKLTAFYTDFSYENNTDEDHLAVGMEFKF